MNAMQLCAQGIHVKPLLNHREDLLMKKKKMEKIGENMDRDRSWTTASALLSDILFNSSSKLVLVNYFKTWHFWDRLLRFVDFGLKLFQMKAF